MVKKVDKPIKTYDEFVTDKQFLNTANDYMIARFVRRQVKEGALMQTL